MVVQIPENESKNLKKVGILLLISIVLTAFTHFVLVNKKATKRRKLFNGYIECTYYQYWGKKPQLNKES